MLVRLQEAVQESWYRATGRTELAEQVVAERQTRVHLEETISDLENRMLEPGWQRLTAQADQEFSRDGLRQITAVCRIMALKNPLIRRGLGLRQAYVWGAGVDVSARDAKVNEVIQAFDDDNEATFTGAQASEELERALGTDGNVFVALFTSPRTGRVRARTLPWDEITDTISNPDDQSEPWLYRREWWADQVDVRTGAVIQRRESAYYPSLAYYEMSRSRGRPATVNYARFGDSGPTKVFWDAPVYHVKVGGHLHWQWGVPDSYAAVDWAHAYKDFLGDWATLVRALARFAWKLTSKGSKQAAAKAKLAAAPGRDPLTGESRHAGATAMLPPDMALEAVPKTGATIDSESGRPLAAMAAAALDVPVTMLLADPGVTGNRATAETLDTPTERTMDLRRKVWTATRKAIYRHVIREAVRAVDGPLDGTITVDADGREVVELAGGVSDEVNISWPDIDDVDTTKVVEAIVKADSTAYLPPLVVARLLLEALGVSDVESVVEMLTDSRGEFLPPGGAAGGVGQAAVDAFRRGEDPAALTGGDPEPEPEAGGATEPRSPARR
ncbi:hypothetical protein BJF79_13745 [Actinomadura sp. CNU-125]|nr:hypothetical protein BJF79_13745 [Actinomadura sp. CNU-125]